MTALDNIGLKSMAAPFNVLTWAHIKYEAAHNLIKEK